MYECYQKLHGYFIAHIHGWLNRTAHGITLMLRVSVFPALYNCWYYY